MLVTAVVVALLFGWANGVHDSSNAVAALVATRAARPGPAVVWAAVFHILGPLVVGTAVANTVGGIVGVPAGRAVPVVGAALSGALAWSLLTWWKGLPASSSHALVGGLVGAAWVASEPGAVHWGGLQGLRPDGVIGVLVWLAVSPVVALIAALVAGRLARAALRRATPRVTPPIKRAEWLTAAALAFSHGANDSQKTMGVITLLLVAKGHLASFAVPWWVKVAAAGALTLGTSMGGWSVVRTLGQGIFRMRPLEGFVSQAVPATIVLVGAAVGAPISTTDVVAPAVVGVGLGRRWRRVRWTVIRDIALSWLLTLPACALLGALAVPVWRWLA